MLLKQPNVKLFGVKDDLHERQAMLVDIAVALQAEEDVLRPRRIRTGTMIRTWGMTSDGKGGA